MWTYEKKLQYPVRIKTPNARTAKYIISQLGGPDGELAASLRYMHQRYTAKPDKVKGVLTDIATEELAHVEMISAILYQLTDGLTPEQIKEAGFDAYFVDHTLGLYPQSAAGVPFIHGCLFPVQGGSDHRPDRGYGGRAKGTEHLRQHSPAVR